MTISAKTRINWLLDLSVFTSALFVGLSSFYFLFAPSGGFQGGRNLLGGTAVVFDRQTWGDLHTWGGVAMIIAITVHLAYHWQWVKSMANKVVRSFQSAGGKMSQGAKLNLLINITIGVSFLMTALSGIYFLFSPSGGYQGGTNPGWDANFIFSRVTWDAIHTWSGVIMIIAAMLHFIIHWRWIKNVTARFFVSFLKAPVKRRTQVA